MLWSWYTTFAVKIESFSELGAMKGGNNDGWQVGMGVLVDKMGVLVDKRSCAGGAIFWRSWSDVTSTSGVISSRLGSTPSGQMIRIKVLKMDWSSNNIQDSCYRSPVAPNILKKLKSPHNRYITLFIKPHFKYVQSKYEIWAIEKIGKMGSVLKMLPHLKNALQLNKSILRKDSADYLFYLTNMTCLTTVY